MTITAVTAPAAVTTVTAVTAPAAVIAELVDNVEVLVA